MSFLLGSERGLCVVIGVKNEFIVCWYDTNTSEGVRAHVVGVDILRVGMHFCSTFPEGPT